MLARFRKLQYCPADRQLTPYTETAFVRKGGFFILGSKKKKQQKR